MFIILLPVVLDILVANCGGSGDLEVFSVDEHPTVAARPTICM
jgi:hypothetical protein